VHTLEELGVDPAELPSPFVAAGASLASFAVGALVPAALPARVAVLWAALGLAGLAAIAAAAWWRG